MNLSQPAQAAHLALRLGIIGGGVMAEAILSYLLHQDLYAAHQVIVSDISAERRAALEQRYGIHTTSDNLAVAQAQTVILAVKPQSLSSVAAELGERLSNPPSIKEPGCELWLSILAGVSLAQLEAVFKQSPVIRVMPNTPATVGAGVTALAPGKAALSHHVERAEAIFGAVGEVLVVPEAWMDAVTGLSGSGPAFVAIAIEALTDGGVAAGLPRAVAAKLALQTVRGTTELLIQKDLHPALLKDQVTSPGGTTIAGVASLEASGFRSALIQAVQAAYRRSQTLGRELKS
ncbi:MAG: pyrroline-5-carboxylate reductase [Thermosynechococcaceae cyanobacterium MS004]|nr:pyrroline-5-carboxylate reductase [Thermosynechococcaceae cyanobacterium MS004]